MDKDKPKDGVSVKEIEQFTKKHRFEVFFCLAFVLATIFTFALWGSGWSIIAAGVGAVIGILLPGKIAHLSKKTFEFFFKHEQITLIVLAVIFLLLAIFVPPLYFLLLGLHGGKDIRHFTIEYYNQKPH